MEFLAEWTLSPTNVAFLRVQTGVLDPSIVGDKPKWYSHQLDTIQFKVWNDANTALSVLLSNTTLTGAVGMSVAAGDSDIDSSETGSEVSTSSSYSSLSDFVSEMVNSEIAAAEVTAHHTDASAHLVSDPNSIFHPPETLQLSNFPLRTKDGKKLSQQGSEASSSPTHSSPSISPSADEEEEQLFKPGSLVAKPDEVDLSEHTLPPVPLSPRPLPTTQSRCSTPQKTVSLERENRPLSAEPSLEKSNSTTSSPTLSRTMSISSVFSRTGSFGSGQGASGSSFLDRLTSEAKEAAREAKAATVAASKQALEATKKEVERQKSSQAYKDLKERIGEPVKDSVKEFWRQSQDESSSHTDSSAASIISSVSSDFNGFADKTSSMFSGLFSAKAAGLAEKMREKAQPFGGTAFPKQGN